MAIREIKSLTGIRGFAALYVVCYHWHVPVSENDCVSAHFLQSAGINFISHGYLSVDLFFVLSGFVLSMSYQKHFDTRVSMRNFTEYILKRFFRIFPLYIVITLVYFFLYNDDTLKILLINLTLLQTLIPHFNFKSIIPPAWSLGNEWAFYLIFPFILHRSLRVERKLWVLYIAAAVILVIICSLRGQHLNWMNYPDFGNTGASIRTWILRGVPAVV